jgi:uncharacterized protein YjbI with pentapeptide repeats
VLKKKNLLILLLVLFIPNVFASNYSNGMVFPCEYKDDGQLEKEANNTKLFIELAQGSKNLCQFSLQGKVLIQFPLRDLNLHAVNLRSTNFSGSDAENVKLLWALLEESSFDESNLKNANFSGAKLNNASLEGAKLVGANFYQTKLDGANLSNAVFGCSDNDPTKCTDITGASFYGPSCIYNHERKDIDCDVKNIVYTNLKGAKNIKSLVYDYSNHLNFPTSLIPLRKHLRDSGFEREAREITYIIQNGLDQEALVDPHNKNISELIDAYFRKLAFSYTVEYGVSPGNALIILLYILIFFSAIYMILLLLQVRYTFSFVGQILLLSPKEVIPGRVGIYDYEDGIFRSENLLRVVNIKVNSLPPYGPDSTLPAKCYIYICKHAFWFSLLSSFHFGWRDLNVGNWLARLQSKSFTYKPTNLFRTLSGVQSLICIYLVAIFVLSYFGLPWG